MSGRGPKVNLRNPRTLAELGLTEQGQQALALLAKRDRLPRSQTKNRRHLLRAAQRIARKALDL